MMPAFANPLVGRCTLPLMMQVAGEYVHVGSVQVDLDLSELKYDDAEGTMFAVLDMHVEGQP